MWPWLPAGHARLPRAVLCISERAVKGSHTWSRSLQLRDLSARQGEEWLHVLKCPETLAFLCVLVLNLIVCPEGDGSSASRQPSPALRPKENIFSLLAPAPGPFLSCCTPEGGCIPLLAPRLQSGFLSCTAEFKRGAACSPSDSSTEEAETASPSADELPAQMALTGTGNLGQPHGIVVAQACRKTMAACDGEQV